MNKLYGTIKITGLSSQNITALNLFFGIRHYRRPISDDFIQALSLTPEDNTLFGAYGADGEYLIPSISYHEDLFRTIPDLREEWRTQDIWVFERRAEDFFMQQGSDSKEQLQNFANCYNKKPGTCPNLWLDFHIHTKPNDDAAYLRWNKSEKTYNLEACIFYLISILTKMGATMEGTMGLHDEGYVDDLVELVTVKGRAVFAKQIDYKDFTFDLVTDFGFVDEDYSGEKDETNCSELILPNGIQLRTSVHMDTEYPSITIDVIKEDGGTETLCFAEYNPEKEFGKELCAGVYRAEDDEPVFYDSYSF